VPTATVVAVGVSTAGHRTVLGCDTGPSEDHAFWLAFLRSLVRPRLKGVKLVISDAHEGLRRAIAKVLQGAVWQRCRVHFMRNLLSVCQRARVEPLAAVECRAGSGTNASTTKTQSSVRCICHVSTHGF
jgi:putative transposase